MKQILCLEILCIIPFLLNAQTPQLHIEGGDVSDNLLGADARVVYAD